MKPPCGEGNIFKERIPLLMPEFIHSDRLPTVKKRDATANGSTDRLANGPSKLQLVEGHDYYLEGKLMVFTAYYLLQRGFCCENDCRHCPYAKEARI